MFEERKTANGFLIGVLTGGAIGGLIALLFAPKSGDELRRNISEKTDGLLTDADHYYKSAKNKATTMLNKGRNKADKLLEEAKKTDGNLSQGAVDYLNDAKNNLSEGLKDLKDKTISKGDNLHKSVNTLE